MKPKKKNLTRAKKKTEARDSFLTPSEFEFCLSGLKAGGMDCLPSPLVERAIRFCISLLEEKCPGGSLEVRVVPFAACKVLQGSRPNPHNLTPPDFLEISPEIFLQLSFGFKSWDEAEKDLNLSPLSRARELKPLFPLLSLEK